MRGDLTVAREPRVLVGTRLSASPRPRRLRLLDGVTPHTGGPPELEPGDPSEPSNRRFSDGGEVIVTAATFDANLDGAISITEGVLT